MASQLGYYRKLSPFNCPPLFALPSHSGSKAHAARMMLRQLPERARQIVIGGDFGGTDIVQVSSDVHRPGFKDYTYRVGLVIQSKLKL